MRTAAGPAEMLPSTVEEKLAGDPETAAAALIQLENQGAHQRNRALLALLWSPDATIVDGRNTPTEADDYRWRGHAAVMDRYDVAVFSAPPPQLTSPPVPQLDQIRGERARLTNGTDQWTIIRLGGRWYLAELRYQQAQ